MCRSTVAPSPALPSHPLAHAPSTATPSLEVGCGVDLPPVIAALRMMAAVSAPATAKFSPLCPFHEGKLLLRRGFAASGGALTPPDRPGRRDGNIVLALAARRLGTGTVTSRQCAGGSRATAVALGRSTLGNPAAPPRALAYGRFRVQPPCCAALRCDTSAHMCLC